MRFPLLGARVMRMEAKAFGLLDDVKGLDDLPDYKGHVSWQVLIVLSCWSSGWFLSPSAESIVLDQATIANIRIMVERSLSFFQGPLVL
ncbi:MAG: hypothetical protein ACLRSA_02050 [Streptococcus salivarius]